MYNPPPMRDSIAAALTPLLASLLLLASCAGGDSGDNSEAPEETAEKTTEKSATTTPETTTAPPPEEAKAEQPTNTLVLINSSGQRVEVQVEIADEREEQERGLRGRTELAEDAGMLFVFDREGRPNIWTKYTQIPISVAFINGQGNIRRYSRQGTFRRNTSPSSRACEVRPDGQSGLLRRTRGGSGRLPLFPQLSTNCLEGVLSETGSFRYSRFSETQKVL